MVNPIRDGLNLVAKEAMLLSEREAVLLLSVGAGAWDELGAPAVQIDAYDIEQAARAIHEALAMDGIDRGARFSELRRRVATRTPSTWLADQLAHA
jgi:trehalose 6-phosphate synthase